MVIPKCQYGWLECDGHSLAGVAFSEPTTFATGDTTWVYSVLQIIYLVALVPANVVLPLFKSLDRTDGHHSLVLTKGFRPDSCPVPHACC